jgi:hypothetical protein
MLCGYAKIKPPLTAYRRGIAEWDDDTNEFKSVSDFFADAPVYPDGHSFLHRDNGVDYLYFASPFPLVRTKATAEGFKDLSAYESFTCLEPNSTRDDPIPDRDAAGRLQYAWKRGIPPVSPQDQVRLVRQGLLTENEGRWQLRNAATGKAVVAHAGSIYWNAYRNRFIMITVEIGGTSMLGEVWYAEAEGPLGPWTKAVKIVTHDKYSFYNPKHHPQFDQEGGRYIYFEGTYTHTFSGNEQRTPRYDYNQIMYRLDLADERLAAARQ